MSDILKNEEINTHDLHHRCWSYADFTIEDANYDKILSATDADTDGAHIQTLLLTFSIAICDLLVEAGRLYRHASYKMSSSKGKKEEVAYAWTDMNWKTHYELGRDKPSTIQRDWVR